MHDPLLQKGCWFCSGAPRPDDDQLCEWCQADLGQLSTFLHRYDGLYIVLTPPHPKGCLCDWCCAILKKQKNDRLDEVSRRQASTLPNHQRVKLPAPAPNTRFDERYDEMPSDKPFIKVTHIDEARRNRTGIEGARNRHPSGIPSVTVSGPLENVTLNGVPVDDVVLDKVDHVHELIDDPAARHTQGAERYTHIPSWEEMASHADEFKRHPERAKAKSSGCWLCEDKDTMGPLCDICQHLVDDYNEWRGEHLPAVEI